MSKSILAIINTLNSDWLILIDFSHSVKDGNFNIHVCACFGYKGNQDVIYNLVKNKMIAAQTCVHFMKILKVCTLNSHIHVLTLKAHIHKMHT